MLLRTSEIKTGRRIPQRDDGPPVHKKKHQGGYPNAGPMFRCWSFLLQSPEVTNVCTDQVGRGRVGVGGGGGGGRKGHKSSGQQHFCIGNNPGTVKKSAAVQRKTGPSLSRAPRRNLLHAELCGIAPGVTTQTIET